VAELVERGISERLACRLVGVHRSSYRYPTPAGPATEIALRATIRDLARAHPRYGYRRITALLRRQGEVVNPKHVGRIWREEGLVLPRKRPRKRRRGESGELPTRATYRGHVWTYDFIFDRTERGQTLKMLVVLDEFSRECHRIEVGRRLDSAAVIATLEELFAEHGAPAFLRSDNGGEFIAEQLKAWLAQRGTGTIYIEPGHPWENGVAESFNGKFRDECLSREVFWGEAHAQVIVERWRREYNEERPHSALGYRTPAEVARASPPSNARTSAPADHQPS
jgi:transposase InsO family protein